MSNFDLFPPTRAYIHTEDNHLTRLLHNIHNKVVEIVANPWSTLQRALKPLGGWRTPQQLGSTLLHFHVALPVSELMFLWSSFPLEEAGFNWPLFVSTLFPTDQGEKVVPKWKGQSSGALTSRNAGQFNESAHLDSFPSARHTYNQQHQQEEKENAPASLRAHPPSFPPSAEAFFGARGVGTSWNTIVPPQYAQQFDQEREELLRSHKLQSTDTFPPELGSPPGELLRRTHRAQHEREQERRRLDRAYVATRGAEAAHAHAHHHGHTAGDLHATTGSQSFRSSFPAQLTHRHHQAAQSTRQPFPVAVPRPEPLPPPVLRAPRPHTKPTYMLPIAKRATAEERRAREKEQEEQKINYAHSVGGKYQKYPDSLQQTNGEKVTTWKNDVYKVPAIQFGQAFKF